MLGQLTLSLSIAGLTRTNGREAMAARPLLHHAAAFRPRALRLDGTLPGLRARELDRSARRDLVSFLRRLGSGFGGIDLWIPTEHFVDPIRGERATSAAIDAIELCAELATLDGRPAGRTLSISLPPHAEDVVVALSEVADRASVRIADHGPDSEKRATGPIGVGIDPAFLLLRDRKPSDEAARAGMRLVAPRLSDTDGIGRVTPGEGRLDLLAYAIALSTSMEGADVILDPRGLPDPDVQVRDAINAWHAVMPEPG